MKTNLFLALASFWDCPSFVRYCAVLTTTLVQAQPPSASNMFLSVRLG